MTKHAPSSISRVPGEQEPHGLVQKIGNLNTKKMAGAVGRGVGIQVGENWPVWRKCEGLGEQV